MKKTEVQSVGSNSSRVNTISQREYNLRKAIKQWATGKPLELSNLGKRFRKLLSWLISMVGLTEIPELARQSTAKVLTEIVLSFNSFTEFPNFAVCEFRIFMFLRSI